MKTYQEGGWEVTTPIYIGSAQEAAKARACAHADWVTLQHTIEDGMELVQERCRVCVAVRMKSRPGSAGMLQFP